MIFGSHWPFHTDIHRVQYDLWITIKPIVKITMGKHKPTAQFVSILRDFLWEIWNFLIGLG
jgi:hypothetical protein